MFKTRSKIGTAIIAIVLTGGCTSINDPISSVDIDSQTCRQLMARGVDCGPKPTIDRPVLAHTEFYQQLLPIHQRAAILELDEQEYRKGN